MYRAAARSRSALARYLCGRETTTVVSIFETSTFYWAGWKCGKEEMAMATCWTFHFKRWKSILTFSVIFLQYSVFVCRCGAGYKSLLEKYRANSKITSPLQNDRETSPRCKTTERSLPVAERQREVSPLQNDREKSPSCRRQRDVSPLQKTESVSPLQKTERRLPVAEDRETHPSCRRQRDVSQCQEA